MKSPILRGYQFTSNRYRIRLDKHWISDRLCPKFATFSLKLSNGYASNELGHQTIKKCEDDDEDYLR
jgi:hypothetical protein